MAESNVSVHRARRNACEHHGKSGSPEYTAWKEMRRRCRGSNKFAAGYADRGIAVCPQWNDSFAAFLADVGPRPGPAFSLDRRNNNKGYEPGNVRWATRKQQQRNTRRNVNITFRGQTKLLTDWSIETGLASWIITRRLQAAWPIEMVLNPRLTRGDSISYSKRNAPKRLP